MKRAEIKKHYLDTMGVGPVGFDYSPLENVLDDIGPSLTIPHRHDYYEVIWFTEGEGQHYVEFAAYDIQPDTILFLGRNQIHAFQDIHGVRGHLLRFSEEFIQAKTSLFNSESDPSRLLPSEQRQIFIAYIKLIQQESDQSSELSHHKDKLLHLLNAFLIEADRLSSGETLMVLERRKTIHVFQQFVTLLEEHYSKEHRVETYAARLALSPKSLNEICQSAAGSTAKKVIAERIMLEARRYLMYTELSVKEISFQLGFEDPAYFSRAFKKATAQSPSDFRNTYLTGK